MSSEMREISSPRSPQSEAITFEEDIQDQEVPPPSYSRFPTTSSPLSISPNSPTPSPSSLPTSLPTSTPTPTTPPRVIVAVQDHFLDDSARNRHDRQQYPYRQSNPSFARGAHNRNSTAPSSSQPDVIVVEATTVPISYSHNEDIGGCCPCLTKRNKIILGVQLTVLAFVLIIMSQTIWKGSGGGGSGNNSGRSESNSGSGSITSAGSITRTNSPATVSPSVASTATTTTSVVTKPSPTSSSDQPWLPCQPPYGCGDFFTRCQNNCKATDPTYKSCADSCNGDSFCTADCWGYGKPCFSTCNSQWTSCNRQCGI